MQPRLALVALVVMSAASARAEDKAGADKEAIRAVVRSHLVEVRTCYEQQLLAQRPKAEGRVMVDFRVEKGVVVAATVKESNLNDAPTEACVLTTMRGWKFDGVGMIAPVTVSYPFIFKLATCATTHDALAPITPPAWRGDAVDLPWPPPLDDKAPCALGDDDSEDLDGDGARERLLVCRAGHSERAYEIYQPLPGGCLRDVGGFVAQDWQPLKTRHHGWLDLDIKSAPSNDARGEVRLVSHLQFDGRKYRVIKSESVHETR